MCHLHGVEGSVASQERAIHDHKQRGGAKAPSCAHEVVLGRNMQMTYLPGSPKCPVHLLLRPSATLTLRALPSATSTRSHSSICKKGLGSADTFSTTGNGRLHAAGLGGLRLSDVYRRCSNASAQRT